MVTDKSEETQPVARLAQRYVLMDVLGEGGLGITHRAHDEVCDRYVAIKVLRAASREHVEALRAEFAVIRGVDHPQVVRALDFGFARVGAGSASHPFLVSALVPGCTWGHSAEGLRDVSVFCAQWVDVLRGLDYLHRVGFAHNDIKPGNVLVDGPHAVLIDLSCSQRLGVATSLVSGTPGFLAPERLKGAPPDARTDLFALGQTLKRLLAKADFGVRKELAEMVDRMASPERARRPADVAEVLECLNASVVTSVRPSLGRSRVLLGRASWQRRHKELLAEAEAEKVATQGALPDAGANPDASSEETSSAVATAAWAAKVAGLVEEGPAKRVCRVMVQGPPGIGRSRLLEELRWNAVERARVIEGGGTRPLTACLQQLVGMRDECDTERLLFLADRLQLGGALAWETSSPGESWTGASGRLGSAVLPKHAAPPGEKEDAREESAGAGSPEDGRPICFFLDDVHLFSQEERAGLESFLRAVPSWPGVRVFMSSATAVGPVAASHVQAPRDGEEAVDEGAAVGAEAAHRSPDASLPGTSLLSASLPSIPETGARDEGQEEARSALQEAALSSLVADTLVTGGLVDETWSLAPFGNEDARRFTHGVLRDAELARAMALTGGVPGALAVLLDEVLATGSVVESEEGWRMKMAQRTPAQQPQYEAETSPEPEERERLRMELRREIERAWRLWSREAEEDFDRPQVAGGPPSSRADEASPETLAWTGAVDAGITWAGYFARAVALGEEGLAWCALEGWEGSRLEAHAVVARSLRKLVTPAWKDHLTLGWVERGAAQGKFHRDKSPEDGSRDSSRVDGLPLNTMPQDKPLVERSLWSGSSRRGSLRSASSSQAAGVSGRVRHALLACRAWVRLERGAEAMAVLRALLRRRAQLAVPDRVAVDTLLGTVLLGMGQSHRATRYAQRASRLLSDEVHGEPAVASTWVLRGEVDGLLARAALQRGDTEEVLRIADRAMSAGARPAEAMSAKAVSTVDPSRDAEAGHLPCSRSLARRRFTAVALLHQLSATACAYQGKRDACATQMDALQAHVRRHPSATDPYSLAQTLAFLSYRMGRFHDARLQYAEALRLAELQGSMARMSKAALNHGTTCHQTGDWGRALDSYERALRCAVLSGSKSTETSIRFNLARLYVDIGASERAARFIEQTRTLASEGQYLLFLAATDGLEAERCMIDGDLDGARRHVRASVEALTSQGLVREAHEVGMVEASMAIESGDLEAARQAFQHHRPAMLASAESNAGSNVASSNVASSEEAEEDSDDVTRRWRVLLARLWIAEGRFKEAVSLLEAMRTHPDNAEQVACLAEIHEALSWAFLQNQAHVLAHAHRNQARQKWERIAVTLPTSLREAFWSHPLRRKDGHEEGARAEVGRDARAPDERGTHQSQMRGSHAHAEADTQSGMAQTTGREEKLRRLIAINRKLNSSLALREVVASAMDAALDLTGAERGFLVLDVGACSWPEDVRELGGIAALSDGEGATLRVVAAHGLLTSVQGKGASGSDAPHDRDQEALGQTWQLSRSIADRVMSTAEPVMTLDARADERFGGQVSVHAMKLKSVVAVPLMLDGGVTGALYLDHRFRPGMFSEHDVDLLVALADQIALALRNASLHEALDRKSRLLEKEKARVSELLLEREAEIDVLEARVKANQHALEQRHRFEGIIGESPSMQQVFSVLRRVAESDVDVLVQGESGTGKELIARATHFNSDRKEKPFVPINCGAIPENLIESELFGHVRGAFTGASQDRLGLFREANGGTLFLDELGELPLSMQVKLLRVLQEREVRPVGGTKAFPIDVRIVGATNRVLRDEIRDGTFREDLFYRVSVVELTLPPLRQRVEDIPALSNMVLAKMAKRLGRKVPAIHPSALRQLARHTWPGNVRELENTLMKAMVLASDEKVIRAEDLDLVIERGQGQGRVELSRSEHRAGEASRLLDALHEHGWNVSEVSRALSIPRATLYRKLRKYGLHRDAEHKSASTP